MAPTPSALIFIDAAVDDYESLLSGINSDLSVAILDPDQDGIIQISQTLSQYRDLTSIHIVSHGAPGCLLLGRVDLFSSGGKL